MGRTHFTTRLPVSFDAVRAVAERALQSMADEGLELDAEVLGFSLGRECTMTIEPMVSVDRPLEVAVVPVRLCDTDHPHAFPSFVGEFEMVATEECDVELALEGDYHPPAGPAGAALDLVALHTLAERTLRGFFEDAAGRISDAARSRDAMRGVPI